MLVFGIGTMSWYAEHEWLTTGVTRGMTITDSCVRRRLAWGARLDTRAHARTRTACALSTRLSQTGMRTIAFKLGRGAAVFKSC